MKVKVAASGPIIRSFEDLKCFTCALAKFLFIDMLAFIHIIITKHYILSTANVIREYKAQ